MPKSIIVVGAGLSGLAVGCYGQMNGYKTRIFEMSDKPGGVCVSWRRSGYTFDYAIHNVFGLLTGSANNGLWQELGALRGSQFYSFEEFVRVEDRDQAFTVYSDFDRLEKHMKDLSPADSILIEEFIRAAKGFSGYDLFAALQGGLKAKIKMLPLLRSVMKWSKISLREYGERFSDPFLRRAFSTIQYDLPDVPMLIPLIFLATLNSKDGGWPIGGSMPFARNIEKRYVELGGNIEYNSKVVRILVHGNDRAVGVRLADGQEYFADVIVSAADGYNTIFGMTQGNYANDKIRTYYNSVPNEQEFGLEVWLGVARDLSKEPHAIVLFLEEPIIIEGEERDRLSVEFFGFDPTLAPPGKSVIKIVLSSNYEHWKNLAENNEKYLQEKKNVAQLIAETLEKRLPGLKDQIEAVDVVTPVSVERWTGAYHGYQVWAAPKEYSKDVMKNGLSRTLPGLKQFYMVGQWATGMVGLNTAALSGRNLIREICKKDGRKFVTTIT